MIPNDSSMIAAQTMNLTDLPSDILYSIFQYLSAAEFLRLTNCTNKFSPHRNDTIYWHSLTRKTFRITDWTFPQNVRWQRLYKKLLTQTQVYTWGNGECDTHGLEAHFQRPYRNLGWPKQATPVDRLGTVVDVQCGGWSSTFLTSIGALHILGIFDGEHFRRAGSSLRRLRFPAAYPQTTKHRYEPSTAIHQYSTGRSSVLGLADDGKVWMWQCDVGFQVKPMHVDLGRHKVKRVVAGWDRSSIYVEDVGIVYWAFVQDSDVLQGGRQETLAVADMMLIDTVTIPGTGYRPKKDERCMESNLGSSIGRVTSHIVLAGYIVFATDLDKVFCYPTTFPMLAVPVSEPIELTTFYTASSTERFRVRGLQGAFERFAVTTHDGYILTASLDLLRAFERYSRAAPDKLPHPLPYPTRSPGGGTQSLAFGDHHWLALQANGTIKAYGREPRQSGALGLGNHLTSKLRGLVADSPSYAGKRLPEGEGRTIWFEPLMSKWLDHMHRQSKSAPESTLRRGMLDAKHEGTRKAYADYFEKEGAKWESNLTAEGEVRSYFALKVAAGGWSSAALVLVDEDKAEKAREAHIVRSASDRITPSPAPSAQSSDSYEVIESPGEQLSQAVYGIYTWIWQLGRSFLGLTARDLRRKARESEKDQVQYTWSSEPFPRLVLPDGEAMPGEIPLTE